MRRRALLLGAIVLVGCEPDLTVDDWLVTSSRVLAVKSEPAEAKPGTPLTYTAFLASADGASDGSAILWRFCTAPKPPTENNVVSTACLETPSLVQAGSGLSVVAATPPNACALFGPDTPPGGFRPRDPDTTGGYYQPLRLDLPGAAPTLHLERVLCDLGNAPFDIAEAFAQQYVPNANPHLAPLVANVGGQFASVGSIPRGARVDLQVSWSAADAETYAYFDAATQTIAAKRESMRVAWHVNAGTLDTESTGRAEDDLGLSTNNGWTAPGTPGPTRLWLVLRDSRGGVDFAAYDLVVAP
jgi:hypothetical protein